MSDKPIKEAGVADAGKCGCGDPMAAGMAVAGRGGVPTPVLPLEFVEARAQPLRTAAAMPSGINPWAIAPPRPNTDQPPQRR